MEEHKRINKILKERFGTELDGRPKFRLVFSSHEFEMRTGEFVYRTEGGIYLGTMRGTQRMPKYEYAKDRWVLEKLVFAPDPELPESVNGHYEPIYIFWDKDGGYLRPEWKVIEILLHFALKDKEKKTEKDFWNEDAEKFKKEVAYFENYFDTASPLETALNAREAVVVPRNYGS